MIQALTRAQVIAQWPTGGDFTLTDLWTGQTFTCRGSPPRNYCHSDWQYKTRADFDISRRMTGRSWTGRPAILRTPSGCVSAVSYHTLNHSIRVASGAYDIVSPIITRATERDANGNWRPGHHMCMHYEDSWRARSNTAYTRDMRAKVNLAFELANKGNTPAPPQSGVPYHIEVTAGVLNIRAGAGTNHIILGQTTVGSIHQIIAENNGWGNLSTGGWVSLQHTRRTEVKTEIIITEDNKQAMVYNRVEQIPEWARPTIQRLLDKKLIAGVNSAGDLNLTGEMLRILVLTERMVDNYR